MNTYKILSRLAYATVFIPTPLLFAFPHTIVLRNATDTTQRIWIHSAYTVKQALSERKEQDLIVREIPPRDSFIYGDRHHTFDALTIKLNPSISTQTLLSPLDGTTLNGLDGTKTIVTITSNHDYELNNKGAHDHKKPYYKDTTTRDLAYDARAKGHHAKQAVETRVEHAATAAQKKAHHVDRKAKQLRDDAVHDARVARDTVRDKTHHAAQTVREKAHDAKETIASGMARARDTVREKGHNAANTIREKTQDTKEALANGVARVQNRTEEARIAASGRWAKMKASMYNWWCSFKIKLSRIFRR